MKKLYLISAVLLYCQLSSAQLTKATRDSSLHAALAVVKKYYVFPEISDSIAAYINYKIRNGSYDAITDKKELAEQLTIDLQKISNDAHLRAGYDPEPENAVRDTTLSYIDPKQDKRLQALLKSDNYGVKKVSVLEGNIGYINITLFGSLDFCADSLTGAMNKVASTDALLIDLRECRGSMDRYAIGFFSGYFFEDRVHLNDLYYRESNDTTAYWSFGWVPGEKYYNKPVYILTSGRTFSGGEEFAYDFKNLKRATLVGEVTGGGANPGGQIRANSDFVLFVPLGRAISPITKTNWEGTGVLPDTMVRSNLALYTAHIMALQQVSKVLVGVAKKASVQTVLSAVRSHPPVFKTVTFALKGFSDAKSVAVTGSFNHWARKGYALKRIGNSWTVAVEAEPGSLTYQFIIDGKRITDPANKQILSENGNTNSVIFVN